MILGRIDVIIIEIKFTINVMYSNHSETSPLIPYPWEKKWYSMKLFPVAQKVVDYYLMEFRRKRCFGREIINWL